MAFFGYELQGNGRWAPVRYDLEVPTLHKTTYTKEAIIEHTAWHQLHPDDVMFSLSMLQRLYPLDEDKRLQNELIERIKQERTKKMVRPVEGFLTSQGKFFDTEAKANLFETNLLLREVFAEAAFGTDTVTRILDTIKVNHELVSEYIQAVKTVIGQTTPPADDGDGDEQGQGEAGNGMDGSAAVDHPPNDPPLWEQEGVPVGDPAATEAAAVGNGEDMEHGFIPEPDKPSKRRKK